MFVMNANRTLLVALLAAGLVTSSAAEKSDSINKTLSDIVVDGLGTRNVRSTDMGRTTLSRDQILKMPVLLSEPDIIKTLQLQPGVSQGTEAFAGLYVHGGEETKGKIPVRPHLPDLGRMQQRPYGLAFIHCHHLC